MLTFVRGWQASAKSVAMQWIAPASLLPGVCAVGLGVAAKAYYSRAGASDLLWILAPSSWLARFVGGIDLVYEQGAGFISHTYHLVVGPACAGVNFLVICFLGLYFSFARHFRRKAHWLVHCVLISYGATVAANGLRIVVSAHLWNADIYGSGLTPEGMHRLAGIAIYYLSLLALYVAVECRLGAQTHRTAPLLWYVGVSLGVPLAGRLYAGGASEFWAHAAWVVGIAVLLTLVKALPSSFVNRIH